MNKRDLRILEKVFEATINNQLPFQSKAKRVQELAEEGYLSEFGRKFGDVTVKGYQLSHLGMLTYCATCGDVEDEERESGGDQQPETKEETK